MLVFGYWKLILARWSFLLKRFLLRLETKHVGHLFCIGLQRSSYNALPSLPGVCVSRTLRYLMAYSLFSFTLPELAECECSSPYFTSEATEEHVLINCRPSRKSGSTGIRISAGLTCSFLKEKCMCSSFSQ